MSHPTPVERYLDFQTHGLNKRHSTIYREVHIDIFCCISKRARKNNIFKYYPYFNIFKNYIRCGFFLKIFLRKSKREFHSSFQVSSILKKELSQKAKIHLHFSKIWSEKQKISSLKKKYMSSASMWTSFSSCRVWFYRFMPWQYFFE